jgi:hypothetical protein
MIATGQAAAAAARLNCYPVVAGHADAEHRFFPVKVKLSYDLKRSQRNPAAVLI